MKPWCDKEAALVTMIEMTIDAAHNADARRKQGFPLDAIEHMLCIDINLAHKRYEKEKHKKQKPSATGKKRGPMQQDDKVNKKTNAHR